MTVAVASFDSIRDDDRDDDAARRRRGRSVDERDDEGVIDLYQCASREEGRRRVDSRTREREGSRAV